jgi:hypothetical protein
MAMSDRFEKKREVLWQQMDGTQRLGYIAFNVIMWLMALAGG